MFSLGFSLLYQSPVPKVFSVMVLIFCFVMVMIRLGPVLGRAARFQFPCCTYNA